MVERGGRLTDEPLRQWRQKFGQMDANEIKSLRSRRDVRWHLDEVLHTIHRKQHSLWSAVDHYGNGLGTLVQRRRDKTATKQVFASSSKGVNTSHEGPSWTRWSVLQTQRESICQVLRTASTQGCTIEPGIPSTHQTTGTNDAPLHISWSRSKLSRGF